VSVNKTLVVETENLTLGSGTRTEMKRPSYLWSDPLQPRNIDDTELPSRKGSSWQTLSIPGPVPQNVMRCDTIRSMDMAVSLGPVALQGNRRSPVVLPDQVFNVLMAIPKTHLSESVFVGLETSSKLEHES
jgi:hypothetical protein